MRIAAIVPVYNGGTDLPRCVAALLAAGLEPMQIVIVDDASCDGVAKSVARDTGARYLASGGSRPRGPARARNLGAAEAAEADAFLFVDADVVVARDTPARFVQRLREHPAPSAVFGSYDDRPDADGLISQYRNLLHHYMHQRSPGEATTFWSGCGVVRRTDFFAVGGFDERFTRASIEDIDFGLRLSDAGYRVILDPDIQCGHLKRWSVTGWLRTDCRARAMPWARLLIRRGKGLPDNLNLGWRERLSAAAALGFLLTLSSAVLLPGVREIALAAGAFALLLFIALQRDLIGFFARTRGRRFAGAAMLLHMVYFLNASATFAVAQLESRVRTSPHPGGP